MKTHTTKAKSNKTALSKKPRLRVALLNPRKATAQSPFGFYVDPEAFTSNPVAERHGNTYAVNLGGCKVWIKLEPGTASIQLIGPCQIVGEADLVWHKMAAADVWQRRTSVHKKDHKVTKIPRYGESKWQRPSGVPWVVISLHPEFVKNDRHRNEISMASALFMCVSHAILEQVAKLADPKTGILPPQLSLDLKLALPILNVIPGNKPAKSMPISRGRKQPGQINRHDNSKK